MLRAAVLLTFAALTLAVVAATAHASRVVVYGVQDS